MPQFILYARDKAGALDVRLENRAAHLDWARAHVDHILMAGPIFADDGETFAGSVFVVEMASLEDVCFRI
ncbi:MAG: YciI family protein, partial [Pseudomonadota bacterium]